MVRAFYVLICSVVKYLSVVSIYWPFQVAAQSKV